MDIKTLLEEPYVQREPCTCYKGLPECPACRQWQRDHGHYLLPETEEPSPAEVADRTQTLQYLRQMIVAEKQRERSLTKRLAHAGVLTPEDRIQLLETKAMLVVHRTQRDLLLYPHRKGARHG